MINPASALLIGLLVLSACKPDIMVNEMCVFNESDLIEPNLSPEAEHVFQLARSVDIEVIVDMPETILPELRGKESNRVEAKKLYQQAAEMGHTGAMNNLAFYLFNGFGNPLVNGESDYTEDHKGAFYWNQEMARRGDPKGYVGMSAYFYSNLIGLPDPVRGEACLVEAAKMDHMRAVILLARQDLGRWEGSGIVSLNPIKVERGIALLEDAALRGNSEAFEVLGSYYDTYNMDWPKHEYYMRESLKMGYGTNMLLSHLYSYIYPEVLNKPDAGQSECIRHLRQLVVYDKTADWSDLETLCPRPDGPLTREQVGLPPAPTQRLNLRAYLTDFQQQHPDL